MSIIKLAVTIMVGLIGAIIAKKLKFVPAAYMIGALFFVLAFNLSIGYTYFPYGLRIVTQAMAGMYIGMRISRKDIKLMKDILPSMLLLLSLFLLMTIGLGYALHKLGGMDLLTAMYASAPGGVSDIGIIADSYGADAGLVTLMQLVRLITVFAYYPFLYSLFEKKGIIKTNRNKKDGSAPGSKSEENTTVDKRKGFCIFVFFSSLGGGLGYLSRVPAGTLIFAMIAAIITHIAYEKSYFPKQMRSVTQLLSGVYLGMRITRGNIAALPHFLIPACIVIAGVLILPIVFGYLVHKVTKLDLATAWFASTVGGMAEMTLLADDMGLDVAKVSLTHAVRLMAVVGLFPHIINFIINSL